MLHATLESYLYEIEQAVESLTDVYVERYEEEIITPERINLRIRIRFLSGQLLELNEALIDEDGCLIHLDYRYHYQDSKNCLLFRYDSTPHFPHHKQVANNVFGNKKPPVIDVIQEATVLNS